MQVYFHWRAFRSLLVFYGLWLGACAAFPLAILSAIYGIWIPTYLILFYYSFRFIFPAKKSDEMRKFFCADNEPYCRSSQIVFDEGAKPPLPGSKTLTTVTPHGILTLGWGWIISSELYSTCDTRWLVAPILMQLPFIADIMHWTSCHSSDAKTTKKYMEAGYNIGLIPGGFQEATLYKRGKHRVFLKNRKGFIKYALKYGYSIQPTYVFGEELTFWTLDIFPTSVAFWLNKFDIPTCIFMGKYLFLPDDDIELTLVVGKSIPLPHIPEPSNEDVDKYHALFLENIQELFNKFKGKHAAEREKAVLEIF